MATAQASSSPAPAPVTASAPPAAAPAAIPIPGLDIVGRGLYLRPYQPYALAQLLFKQQNTRVVVSKETGERYAIPDGYEINDSPPFPMNESLNQVFIEESWDRFEKHISLDANAAISNMPFSVSATASWNSRLRSEQDAYYAMRSSFVPLWMVYVPNPHACIPEVRKPDIPTPFSHSHRRKYEEFFRTYGSHYVKGAWVGGKSSLVFSVLKSSQLSTQDIQAGIKASFAGIGGGASTRDEQSKERLRQSSQCTVFGKGGDEFQLAAMSSLDEAAYNQWLKTVRDNPQVIELDVAGLWTLIEDPVKAATLMEAYKESVSFDPITSVFDMQREIFFIRGNKFVRYDREKKVTGLPEPISGLMPLMEDDGFERIDAAFRGKGLVSPSGEKLDRKLFVFRQNRFLRFDLDKLRKDDGYPMLLQDGWPGLPFDRIDSAMVTAVDTVYFFFGNQYVRFNPLLNRVDDGYPQPISRRWAGVTFDRIDAAVYWGDGQVYFFRGDQHIRYDLANYRADPGFPKYIIGNYVEDWKFIDD